MQNLKVKICIQVCVQLFLLYFQQPYKIFKNMNMYLEISMINL